MAAPVVPAELSLTSADGLRLVGSAWAPAVEPRGVVVVVHGLKDHAQRYHGLAAALTQDGWAVEGFDLRGHARSEGPRAWVRRFDDLLGDLDRVFALVRERHPGLPIVLFGHSMGGALATRYVETRAPSLRGLVLSGAALRPPPTVSRATIAVTKLIGALAPHAAVFASPNPDFSRDPAVVADMDRDPLIYQRPAAARTAVELLRTMDRIHADAGRLSVPLLALHGTADRLTNPTGSEALVETAGSSDKTYRPFPGLYHDLLHEPERDDVLRVIRPWVAGHLRA